MWICIKEFLIRDRRPELFLKEAWRVQSDEGSPRRTGIDKSIAEQEDKFKNDLRVQGVPHEHGSNKLVTNLNNNEQETSEVQFEEYASKLDASDFACRSKAKAKPQRRESASTSTRTFPMKEKNLDRCCTRRLFNLRLWSVEEINSSSSSWTSTSRKWWSDWILENQTQSSRTFLVLSSLVWRHVEEKHGKRRRKQEQIPVWYWFARSNLVPPSSSRPFRTQSHWSYFAGQCPYSEQLLPIHLSCPMCNQFIFHHQFGIDTKRSKFEQQTDSILFACGSHGQKTIRILLRSTWVNRVIHNTCIEHGRNIKTQYIGSTSILLLRKD